MKPTTRDLLVLVLYACLPCNSLAASACSIAVARETDRLLAAASPSPSLQLALDASSSNADGLLRALLLEHPSLAVLRSLATLVDADILAELPDDDRAAAAGAIVAADAAAHLPVLGFLLPGPLEYVGACAAALLAARYYVTKDATAEEDLAALGARLPSDVPAAEDVVAPARAVANSLKTFASDFDFDVTKGDITEWFNGLEDPVETIAPPAAALFVANLIVYAAHVPVFNVAAPRALELAGVAVALAAVEKYGASDGSARFQEDLGRYARQGGDAVKQLIEK